MKSKKTIMITAVVLLLVIVSVIGASYAYFATVNKTTGNEKDLNIVTEDLGNIKWEGTKVYTSGNLLPGECGIQTFTIEKNTASGKGIYEIDLKGVIADEFGDDVEITLYKSTNPTTNNVTIKEGNSTISGDTTKQYYKEDSVMLNGTPEKVYGAKALQNKDQIILEQVGFDNSTLQKTTYYLVYCYKNNGNQDKQQGKSFSGEISVRLILEKTAPNVIGEKATEAVTMLANYDSTNLATDDYGNTRYIGSDPNNYVSIDGDIWRIIGTMKSVDDGTGNKEDRVKLIRASSIGNYVWHGSAKSVNDGDGVNEWSQADLMNLLNPGYENRTLNGSLYWNNQSGWCSGTSMYSKKTCDFTSTGIKDKLKILIGNAVWNTGSNGSDYSWNNIITSKFYELERSANNGKICSSGTSCNDTVVRTTTWTGKVGLMYPSDYGYATSGGSTIDRAACLNKVLYKWSDSNVSDCKNNDWLYDSSSSQWTISPFAYSSYASNVFIVYSRGYVSSYSASINNEVRPVVYLTSNVKIASGTGSQDNPFILEN